MMNGRGRPLCLPDSVVGYGGVLGLFQLSGWHKWVKMSPASIRKG